MRVAKFALGQVVRHKTFGFRGVIFDVDPVFNNSEEWWNSIPKDIRPHKDQPFYHILAERGGQSCTAYVSEQNLVEDNTNEPVDHPQVTDMFGDMAQGRYQFRHQLGH